MSPPEKSMVESLLDEGSRGLLYFEHYLPILRRVDPASNWNHPDLCARYDEQRGLDTNTLVIDASTLSGCVAVARDQLALQQGAIDQLDSAWSGAAAESAVADLRSDVRRGRARTEALNELCGAVSFAAESLHSAVADKAAVIGQFDPTSSDSHERSSVDGMTFDQVRAIDFLATIDPSESLTFAQGLGDIRSLAAVLPSVIAPAPASPGPENFGPTEHGPTEQLRHARAVSEKWLRETFAPIVDGACRNLVDVCAATDTEVRGVLSTLAAVVDAVNGDGPPGTEVPVRAATAEATPRAVGGENPAGTSVAAERARMAGGAPLAPASGEESTPTPADERPADVRAAVESVLGTEPDCEQLGRAFERAGHELTERMKSLLGEAVAALMANDAGASDTGGQGCPGVSETPRTSQTPRISDNPDNPDDRPSASGGVGRDEGGASGARPAPEAAPPHPIPSQPAPPAGEFVERGHFEAALDGHSARIALAHNGAVALELGTPIGSSRFELKPGPFGLPIVVCTDEPTDTVGAFTPAPVQRVDNGPQAPAAPTPAPEPEPAAVPTPTPTPTPTPEPAAMPAAGEVHGKSGARLMEAGPL